MDGFDTILSVTDLHISFAGAQPFTAVDHISFQIEAGKTLAIVGESGSGKSLTALSLAGLLPSNATIGGSLMLHIGEQNFPLTEMDTEQWQQLRGKHIGMVFQEPMSALNPIMSIGKQLTESILTHNNLSTRDAKKTAIEWLRKVQLPEPEKLFDRYPHQISGGQKQRVMIAMAMCNDPRLLIADEPTTALDVTVQKEIIQLMAGLQKQSGTAMIFITHDLALASEIADEVLVMYKGKIVEYGPAQQVLHRPQHPYTQALVACRPSPDHKGQRLPIVADFMNEEGPTTPLQNRPIINIKTDVLLKVNDLRVWFTENKDWLGRPTDYYKAVDDVSFELSKGEILGLVGESGCGKSTISRSLMGLLPVKTGQIIFDGEDITATLQRDRQKISRQIQMIFQDPYSSLNPRITVGDMLTEPLRVHHIVPLQELKKEALRLLDLVQLPADAFKRYPHQFSGGQRQRLGIARALALRPRLLICDESVSALDVSVDQEYLNLLKDLQHEFQLSYLFISHDLSVVHYISDRVMVMQAGHIVERGDAEQVLKHPENDYTRKLVDAAYRL